MNLSDMLKKQKERKANDSNRSADLGHSVAGDGHVPSEEVKSQEPAPKKLTLGGLNLNKLAPKKETTDATPHVDKPVVADAGKPLVIDSVDALAALDVGDIEALESIETEGFDPFYLDQIAATAPIRDLPAELTDQQRSFIESLDALYSGAEPELLAQVCVSIMTELQSHPALDSQLMDEDIRTLIIAMRNSMGLARVKKATAKTKPASGGATKKPSGNARVNEVLSILDSLGDDL